MKENRRELNRNLAQMLKGGVIMDVTTPEQARIAEAAGACAVMALERIPADIRAAGGVSRMSDPKMIRGIQELHQQELLHHLQRSLQLEVCRYRERISLIRMVHGAVLQPRIVHLHQAM